MRRLFLILTPLLLFAFSDSHASGICKWVDANGVTHFAESCPENTAGTEVELEPPPPAERIEEAERRYEQSRIRQQARRVQDREAAGLQAEERAAFERQAEVDHGLCVHARRNLGVLEFQLPVYYDERGWLQHNESIHSRFYTGTRRYVEDADRPALMRDYQSRIDRHCGRSEADIRRQVDMMVAETERQARCANLMEMGYRADRSRTSSRNPDDNAVWFRDNCL